MSQQSHPAWVPVSSSAISAVAYDSVTQELLVRFLPSGTEYAYANVTRAEHSALISAESVGRAFNQQIKPNHPVRKITPP